MARADYSRPDHYSRRARQQGYDARSVFKLEEVDQAEQLLRPGDRVLDLGAAPGSWMQYAAQRVGERGLVVGVDLKALERALAPNERFYQADVHELADGDLRREFGPFHLVLSDMMPNTMGHKATDHLRSIAVAERALWLAERLLQPGGGFLVKAYQGADFDALVRAVRGRFRTVKIKKPRGSRARSREIYILGRDFLGQGEEKNHGPGKGKNPGEA